MIETHGRYDYSSIVSRPDYNWPGGKRLAVYVALNIEQFSYGEGKGAAIAPPEQAHSHSIFSWRDYGNRVGFWRMAEMFDALGVKASISLNVAVLDHFPEIGKAMVDRGWELFSHGVYNTRYQYAMSPGQEAELVRDVAASIRRVSGQTLAGWLSPALSNTPQTMNVLAKEGVMYTLDLFHDDQPQPVRVREGKLVSLPYSLQINDWTALHTGSGSPRDYARMIKAQFDRLYEEGAGSGTVMCLPLHPWMIGYPHRCGPLAEAIEYVLGHDGVWHATAREIAGHYMEHYHDRDLARLSGAGA